MTLLTLFKNQILQALLLLATFFVCITYFAETRTANFPIEALVYSAVGLTSVTNMSFGTRVVISSGQADVSATQEAVMQATGNPDAAITGTFSNSSINLTCSTGSCTGDSINVDNFRCTSGLNTSCTGNLNAQGQLTININATLHQTPNNRAGSYQGDQTFNLNYS